MLREKLNGHWASHMTVNLPVDARVDEPEGNFKIIVLIGVPRADKVQLEILSIYK